MYFCHSCHQHTPQFPCHRCESEFVEEMDTVDPLEEIGHAFIRAMQNRNTPQGNNNGNNSRRSPTNNQQTTDQTPNTNNNNGSNTQGPHIPFSFPSTENPNQEQGSQDMLFNIFDLINSVGEGMQFQMNGEGGGLNDLLNQLFQQHEASEKPVPQDILSKLKKKEFLTSRDCAICQDTLEYGLELKCKHCYHEDCIKEWFKQQNTCPVCRAKVCEDEDCEPIERPTSVPPPRRNPNQPHNRSRSVPRDPFSLFINTSNNERSPISPPIRRRYIQPGDLGFVMMEQDQIDTSNDYDNPIIHAMAPEPRQQRAPVEEIIEDDEVSIDEEPPALEEAQEAPPRRRSFFSRLFRPNSN